MGLANNNIVKGIVTGLTDLLNIINKITGALGNSTNFVLKWVAAFGAYKGLKAIFRGGGLLDKTLGTIVSGTGVGTALAKGGVLSGKTLTGTMAGVTPTVVTAAPRVGLFGRMAAYK